MGNDKLFTKHTLILTLVCIAVNFFGARLALSLDLPVFFDVIGTILAAVLGGYMPGIVVGFATNAINSFADPITMYYGILSITIAITASFLAERGVFRNLWRVLLSSLIFAFLGGFLGTLITWMLYGLDFGNGISENYAIYIYEHYHLSKFSSQALADYIIDFGDKLIAVIIVYAVIKILPRRIADKLPLGFIYHENYDYKTAKRESHFKTSSSLRTKVIVMMMLTIGLTGTMTVTVGLSFYKNNDDQNNIDYCNSALDLMKKTVKADEIDTYLSTGEKTASYHKTQKEICAIKESFPRLEYMYVYDIQKDGCHVVFDVETAETEASQLGDVIPFDDAFLSQKSKLLAGKQIEPLIANDSYGWLMSVYEPIKDSDGECVAYAAVDISMRDIMLQRYEFSIRLLTIIMGVAIFIAAFAIWYGQRRIVNPMEAISDATKKFAYDDEDERNADLAHLKSLDIKTGDEIENLYNSISKGFSDIVHYINVVNEKNNTISKMQDNIIISFAEMVENRDENTGNHIKRTAKIVEAIGRQLFRDGYRPDLLTEAYLNDMIKSAPLHDIGKIKIPDAVLNKPGKLTAEEFDMIKIHTTAGADILKGAIRGIEESSYLAIAIDMAEYHHEKWNGTGYPTGIAGEDIPLCARIMAVADVFDALTSKRSYKEAFSFEKAISIISEDSGKHFDPEIVNAFINIKDDKNITSPLNP